MEKEREREADGEVFIHIYSHTIWVVIKCKAFISRFAADEYVFFMMNNFDEKSASHCVFRDIHFIDEK